MYAVLLRGLISYGPDSTDQYRRVLAVLRLMTNSTFTACMTDKSDGVALLRIRGIGDNSMAVDDIQVSDALRKSLYGQFQSLGEIMPDGRSFLKEVTVTIDRFNAIIRPNESQHRGRPHCLIVMGEDSATFDIDTGKLLAGTLKSWNRTAEKVVANHSAELREVWDKTRPDDQRLK
jgi:hypothetical protein